MHLPSQCFAPYASPLPGASASGYAAPAAVMAPGQAAWTAMPQARAASVESMQSGVAGVRQFATEMQPVTMAGVRMGQPQMYQQSFPAGQVMVSAGTPMSYVTPSSVVHAPMSAYLPTAAGMAHLGSHQAVQASAPRNQGALAPGTLLPAGLVQVPTAVSPAAATAIAVPVAIDSRSARRIALCEQAFQFVDALRTGYINVSQNKTGLTMVFEQLGDVPMPKDEWFVQVFRNFALEDKGLVDFSGFKDIVRQWDEHHQQKRQRELAAAPLQQPRALVQSPMAGMASQASGVSGMGSGCGLEGQAAYFAGAAAAAGGLCPSLPVGGGHPAASGYGAAAGGAAAAVAATGMLCGQIADSRASVDSATGTQPSPAGAWAGTHITAQPSQYTTASTETDDTRSPAPSRASTAARGARTPAAGIVSEVMFPTYVGRLAIFDDYEFFGDVGAGSFGKVMVVRHRLTKQLRACKVVAVQTALQRELIDTEITLLKSLNHPNIMKMHEVYFEQERQDGRITNGNIYLVTELCEGGDLFSRILHHYERLKQPMTEAHVAFMMQQILSATKYCHDKGIIHRDIKPENILFVDRSSSSPLKIIDFGLANFHEKIREQAKEIKVKRQGALGRLARMLPGWNGKHLIPLHERKKVMQKAGTPHYMAPEMIEGSYDQKADLFSIGIILCQLFTGWHPFYVPGDDEAAVRAKITSPEPVQFPKEVFQSVSSDAQNLCRKLLEKSPKNRFTAAQALAHPWFRDPSKPSPFGNPECLSASIFDGLMQYQAYNKLKRAVLQLLTRELSEFQIQELRGKFMALDTQGDGLLSPDELIEGMRLVGYEMTPQELNKLMAALDGTGNQRIGYKEFISALIERRVKFDRQQLLECFKKFDRSGTGRITYDDIQRIMCPMITQSEWHEIASPAAKPGAEKCPELTFDEFVALMEQDA